MIGKSEQPGLEIPPLPTRCELDDEMREAFLADAIDLFERIERIVVGLVSLEDHHDAIQELSRCFHTLTWESCCGQRGPRMELATLVHGLEERLGQTCRVSPELNDLLHQVVDYLDKLIGWLRTQPTTFHEATALPTSGTGAILSQVALPPVSSAGRAAGNLPQPIATPHLSRPRKARSACRRPGLMS